MPTEEELKQTVKDKYAKIALGVVNTCCCGPDLCNDTVYNIMSDEYTNMEGYVPEADLGLGCGIPTDGADIPAGATVLDLGSGAGNDAFIAAAMTGPEGLVIGVDMTQAMIDKANANKAKRGIANVDFRLGEIENLPVDDASVDVVLSNCVLNLVPDKKRAFREIARVTKSGARFSVSDIVFEGEMSPALKDVATLYAGCVSGAVTKQEYLDLIAGAGFIDVRITKEKEIVIPAEIVDGLRAKNPDIVIDLGAARIVSITVKGRKQ